MSALIFFSPSASPAATINYTIYASAGEGGTISPSGQVAVAAGSTITFTITPDPGYVIAGVYVNESSVGSVSSYTFENVDSDQDIHAFFVSASTTVNLTATAAGPYGSITPSGSIDVTYGTDQTFTITPISGYRVLNVIIDGNSWGPMTSYTFEAVTYDQTMI